MVKIIITALMTLIGFNLFSQIDCNIMIGYPLDTTVYYNDTTLCYNTNLKLYTEYDVGLNYSWEPTGQTGVIIDVAVQDTITYILNVYNDDSTFHCTDTVTLNIFPIVTIEFEQLVFGCPPSDTSQVDTICKAQVKAAATGGYPPYHYYWGDSTMVNPGDSSWALDLCVNQTYTLIVRDTVCIYSEMFDVKPFPMPEIEVTMEPDSLFITNPQALFSFENKSADSIELTSWTWIFPDGSSTNQINPRYVFVKEDSLVKFTYTTIDNCNDTVFIPIDIREFKPTIPNVFTPNGDGVNDRYEIPYLDRYLSSELVVFNRWGEMVFKGDNYSGTWDGGSLPDGVYFYILTCQGYWEEEVFRGSVSIYGSRH
jgi:gliding motility-associated-like protein